MERCCQCKRRYICKNCECANNDRKCVNCLPNEKGKCDNMMKAANTDERKQASSTLVSAESDKMDRGNSCSNSSQSKKYLAKPESASQLKVEPLPLKICVLLWNINGIGETKLRNRLVPDVVKEIQPDVILLQEIETDKLVKKINKPPNEYEEVFAECTSTKCKKETRILFNTEKFTRVTVVDFSAELKTSVETVALASKPMVTRSVDARWQEIFRDRTSIVGLTRKGYDTTIVFLSFHNAYTGLDDDERKEYAERFCKIVSEISIQTGYTVIAGADLNCKIAFGDHNGAIVLYYEATRRRKKEIDHFIVAPPGITGKLTVKALNFVKTEDDDRLRQPMDTLKREFKHDCYHDALDRGLEKGLNKEALHKALGVVLSKGLDEGLCIKLDEALGKGLDEALGKILDEDLRKSLHKGLHKTLHEALDKALHKDLDEAAGKALDHDPILLEYANLQPSAAATHNALLETIANSIKTREPPSGKKAICAIQKNGGITKTFDTKAELVQYIYSEHGDSWKQHVQLKDISVQPAQPDPNQQSNGNCLFEALQRTKPDSYSTHEEVRSAIVKFYDTASQQQSDTITRKQGVDLRQRQQYIAPQGVWGEAVEVLAFASIHQIAIKVSYLNELITYFPVDDAGKEVKDAEVASTTLEYITDHWRVLE